MSAILFKTPRNFLLHHSLCFCHCYGTQKSTTAPTYIVEYYFICSKHKLEMTSSAKDALVFRGKMYTSRNSCTVMPSEQSEIFL